MNSGIPALSNEELAAKLTATAREERRMTIEVLHLLREAEKRELFARLGFSSLFTYCVEHLKYSESAAQRRIVAMRALRELPELEEKIETGTLSLSVIAMAESTLRQCAKRENRNVDAAERRSVLQEVENLSRRKAESKLTERFDLAPAKIEMQVRPMSNGGVRLVLEFSAEELSTVEELLRLSSRPQTTKELILSLIKAESAKKKRRLGETPLLRKSTAAGDSRDGGGNAFKREATSSAQPRISVPIKRQIWTRAQGRCEHRTMDGSRCLSMRTLEFDHVIPKAHGGSDEPKNLRLLCRTHHRLVTIESFGNSKMQQYRPTLR